MNRSHNIIQNRNSHSNRLIFYKFLYSTQYYPYISTKLHFIFLFLSHNIFSHIKANNKDNNKKKF